MKNCKSIVNRFGFRVSIGKRVGFRRVNDANTYSATVKAIDKQSEFAKAYGAQVSFSDNPSTVTANDCMETWRAVLSTV